MWWLRQYVRSRMSPIPQDTARLWKKRLSIMYMLFGWHLGALSIYIALKDHFPDVTDENPSKTYAKMAGISKAKVIKYSGFSKVGEYDVHNEDIEEGTDLGLGVSK